MYGGQNERDAAIACSEGLCPVRSFVVFRPNDNNRDPPPDTGCRTTSGSDSRLAGNQFPNPKKPYNSTKVAPLRLRFFWKML